MTDLGHVTDEIRDMAHGVDGILIESNYDYEMLITGPYDYVLKRRVGGPYGHLSNEDCAQMIKELIENGTKNFMLGHLSEENNLAELAYEAVRLEIMMDDSKYEPSDFEIKVAKRSEVSQPVAV